MSVVSRVATDWNSPWSTVLLAALMTSTWGPVRQSQADTALEVKGRGQKVFYVDAATKRNQVAITSESVLDDFTIVCNQVSGQLAFDPQHAERISGRFTLKVKDLGTGMDLRDHLLGSADWLDAAKYPEIQIAIDGGERAQKTAPNTVSMLVHMRFTMHGVTKEMLVPWTVTYLDESPQTRERAKGDLVRLRTQFEIQLSDFHVVGPPVTSSFVGLYVANRLPVKATVFGATGTPPAAR